MNEEYQRGCNDTRTKMMEIIDTYLDGKLNCTCEDCNKIRDDIKKSINS
jgi:hypothetical protein